MTLLIKATGQSAEVEECVEGGYYLRVAGHARYFELDAVHHPALCPKCGSATYPVTRRIYGGRYAEYRYCESESCEFIAQVS